MALSAGALNVITAVKYDLDLINSINRMTFLFDPNWQGIGNTLPISFFFVKEFKEVMESEISQKPLLFYNSQKADNANAVSGGLLGIISDNIIAKPKKYQMSIVIPRSLDTYLRQSIFSKRVTFGDLYDNPTIAGLDALVAVSSEMLIGLIKALGSSTMSSFLENLDIKDYVSKSLLGSVEDSNKVSLDMMWENRTLLRMKYWNGWRFKYVAIESYIPSKQGDEDDFFEATLNVTEVPIMTTRKISDNPLSKLSTSILSDKDRVKTKNISKLLDSLEEGKISIGGK